MSLVNRTFPSSVEYHTRLIMSKKVMTSKRSNDSRALNGCAPSMSMRAFYLDTRPLFRHAPLMWAAYARSSRPHVPTTPLGGRVSPEWSHGADNAELAEHDGVASGLLIFNDLQPFVDPFIHRLNWRQYHQSRCAALEIESRIAFAVVGPTTRRRASRRLTPRG